MSIDNQTPNYGWLLPHPDNNPKLVDVQRIADAITSIDALVKSVSGVANAAQSTAGDAATAADVDARIEELIGAAPAALDTLAEIAAELEADNTLQAAFTNQITALQTALTALVIGDIEGLGGVLDDKADQSALDTLSTGTATALGGKSNNGHGHAVGDISGIHSNIDLTAGTVSDDALSANIARIADIPAGGIQGMRMGAEVLIISNFNGSNGYATQPTNVFGWRHTGNDGGWQNYYGRYLQYQDAAGIWHNVTF